MTEKLSFEQWKQEIYHKPGENVTKFLGKQYPGFADPDVEEQNARQEYQWYLNGDVAPTIDKLGVIN